ncbi:hypothetical protein ABQF35_05125 [Mycobacterium syngnathidarum]
MRKSCVFAVALLVASVQLGVKAPVASAADSVTYEIVSDSIGLVNVEYVDSDGRHLVHDVALPWRLDRPIADAQAQPPAGAQLRAEWWTQRAPSRWVTVRIFSGGKLLCESVLDVGNASCYGVTPLGLPPSTLTKPVRDYPSTISPPPPLDRAVLGPAYPFPGV